MNIKNSSRIETLSTSLTMEITSISRKLKAQGKDIVSFSAGEPDFDTPKIIKEASIQAIQNGFTKYTAVEGTLEVRQAICDKLRRDNGLHYQAEDIVVSNGAKHSLFNLFQILVDSGDEVIIPSPYWVTYPEQVKFSNGIPVILKTDESTDFKITPEQLQQAISPKTKILLLNTPCNPTGSVYTKEELQAIAEVLADSDILILSDEMYERIMYDNKKFTAVASINDDMFQRTITINGLSKSVAMTGWRFGYIATPNKNIIKNMIKLQGQMTSNVNSITQKAAIPALQGLVEDDIIMMKNAFEARRNFLVSAFNSMKNISCYNPQGAFYLFVNISKITLDSMNFCKNILEKKWVALVPWEAFGMKWYFRLSFATSMKNIEEGVRRIQEFLEEM